MFKKTFSVLFTAIIFSFSIHADDAVEEVVVTGSYIKGSPTDGASPVEIFSKDAIENMGAVDIADITANLSVNSGSENNADSFTSGSTQGRTNVNLRGLGLSSTLVLIDGKRQTVAGSRANDGSVFVDTSAIPLVALERVEVLKEGAGEDFVNKDSIAKLLRFASSKGDGDKKTVSLAQYLERKIEEQQDIYYICAETFGAASQSPHLEVFKDRGIEVLLMFDRIDEWLMNSLTEFEKSKFVDVMRGDIVLPGEAKAEDESEKEEEEDHPLVERIEKILGEKVDKVRASKRLTDSPACLVLNENAMGIQMKKIMEASGQSMPETKPYFEFNPTHPLLERLDSEADEDRFKDIVELLFDQANLAEGSALQDPAQYVSRLNKLLLELLEPAA